jgi:hypothetical protein
MKVGGRSEGLDEFEFECESFEIVGKLAAGGMIVVIHVDVGLCGGHV